MAGKAAKEESSAVTSYGSSKSATSTLISLAWISVIVQRYLCWAHTTPTILLLLKLISPTTTTAQFLGAVACDWIMMITGCAAAALSGPSQVALGVISHLALLPILVYLHKTLSEMITLLKTDNAAAVMTAVYYFMMTLWLSFGMVWLGGVTNTFSMQTEEALFLVLDFGAKVLLSSSLLLGSFKRIELRREEAMRVIEAGGRLATIAELREVVAQKERFMSTVSHELRTPLNGIIGISDGLLAGVNGPLEEEVSRSVTLVRTSGARLLSLLSDIMDAAALRANCLAVRPQVLTLKAIVDDVVQLTWMLTAKHVEVINRVPSSLCVFADGDRLVQVLNNLLGNAAKFTHKGRIVVSAKASEDKTMVVVSVSDSGIGIPESKLSTIFEPFGQADAQDSRAYGGFGLGLNITKELVKAHGGDLTVDSVEGHGSTFTFTLPLANAAEEGTPSGSRAASAGSVSNVGENDLQKVSNLASDGLPRDLDMQYSRYHLSALANTMPTMDHMIGEAPIPDSYTPEAAHSEAAHSEASADIKLVEEGMSVEDLLTSLELYGDEEERAWGAPPLTAAMTMVRDEMKRVKGGSASVMDSCMENIKPEAKKMQ